MKFLTINPQKAVNIDSIESLSITGTETNAVLEIGTKSGDSLRYKYYKSFPDAEEGLRELRSLLERHT